MLQPLAPPLAGQGLAEAIEAGAIASMIALLAASSPAAREQAAYCLAALTVELREKAAARKAEATEALVALLHAEGARLQQRETDGAVITAALAALMSLTAENEGKASRRHRRHKHKTPRPRRSPLAAASPAPRAPRTPPHAFASAPRALAPRAARRAPLTHALARLGPRGRWRRWSSRHTPTCCLCSRTRPSSSYRAP